MTDNWHKQIVKSNSIDSSELIVVHYEDCFIQQNQFMQHICYLGIHQVQKSFDETVLVLCIIVFVIWKKTHIILYQFCFLINKLLLVKWIILNEGTRVQNRRTIKLYWCGPTSKWRENLTLYEFDCVCVNLTEKIRF